MLKWLKETIKANFRGVRSIGPLTIYGFDAMHLSFSLDTPLGRVCFHPTVEDNGIWPWYLYLSPNRTPRAAILAWGPGVKQEDKVRAKARWEQILELFRCCWIPGDFSLLTTQQIILLQRLLDEGLLFQINREVLHPMGLALMVLINEHKVVGLKLVSTPDPAGMIFDEHSFNQGESKLEAYKGEWEYRIAERKKKYGFAFQFSGMFPQKRPAAPREPQVTNDHRETENVPVD